LGAKSAFGHFLFYNLSMETDISELYSTRMLIFIEDSPQSNKYRQLMLTPEEFTKVAFSFGKVTDVKDGVEDVEIRFSKESYNLPDLPEMYQL
jgi:hypothetical protein